MRTLSAGKFNRRVVLQQRSASRGSMGSTKKAYTDVATVWAAVQPLRGQELFEVQKTTSEVTIRIRIRFRDDIEPTWRIQQGLKFYGIVSVINQDDGRQEIQLLCRELPNGEPI